MINDALKLIQEHDRFSSQEQEITEMDAMEGLVTAGLSIAVGAIFGTIGYFKGRRDLAMDVVFDKYKKQAQEADNNVMATVGMINSDSQTNEIFKSRREFIKKTKKAARVFSIIQRGGRQELIRDARLAFVSYLELALDLYKKELPVGQKSLVKTVKSGLKSLK